MTYSNTHLGVAVLAIYIFFPKKLKDYLKDNPRTFFYTSLGAVLPDIDLITSGHRAYGHTIFLPLLLMIGAPILAKYSNRENVSKNIRIFALFWLSHMLYDTTFGPMALFYPLDPRFYDINIGIVFNLTTGIILPLGFFVSIEIIDQSTGVNTFFVNWSAEDRVSYFGGDTINWPISDFFLHATVFFFYLSYVLIPFIRWKFRNKETVNEEKHPSEEEIDDGEWKYLHAFRNKLSMTQSQFMTLVSLILLCSSLFYIGPYHGQSWEDHQEDSGSLYVLQDSLQILVDKTINVPDNAKLNGELIAESEDFTYELFFAILPEDDISTIRSNISDLTSQYQDGDINFRQFENRYQLNMFEISLDFSEHFVIQSVQPNSSIQWEFQSDEPLHLIYGVYQWVSGTSFVNNAKLDLTWDVDISTIYWTAFILFILNLIGIFAFVYYHKVVVN